MFKHSLCSDSSSLRESKASPEGRAPAAATCGVGEGVVQTFAQRCSRQREGGLHGGVHLLTVLCGRARSRHPGNISLPLSDGQLLPQVCRDTNNNNVSEDTKQVFKWFRLHLYVNE